MRRSVFPTLFVALLLAAVSAVSAFADTVTVTDITLLQAAIDAAPVGGRTITIDAGTHVLGLTNILVNKPDITIQGQGTLATRIQVSGAGYRFSISAAGCTIRNLELEKTDKPGVQNIIYVGAQNTTIQANMIHGQFVMGEGDVARAIEVTYGMTNLQITGNEIYGLRQPAYINGSLASPTTGTISSNYVHDTKGWVLAGANMTFSGNTWGTGATANYVDIAILTGTAASYYPDIVAVGNANNAAVVEDQRAVPPILSIVAVNAASIAGGDGTPTKPYQAITPAVTRVVAGGTINVAAGLYHERLTVNKSLRLLGAQYGVDPTPLGARSNPATETVIDLVGQGIVNPNVLLEIPAGTTDVTVAGFTLNGSTISNYADEATIRAWDDRLTIEDNIISGFYGVLYKGNDHFVVRRNRMTTGKVGFTAQPNAATDVTIEGNRIVPGSSPASDAAGMYLTGVNGGVIRGNIVSGFTGSNAIGGSHLTSFLIEENQLTGCKKGVNVWGNTTFIEVRENQITGHLAEGIVIKGQDLSIHNNVVTGNVTGVTIDKNTLVTERVAVHGNDLSGNSLWALNVTSLVLSVVDATGNYWGTVLKSEVAAETSGLVNYTPWCNFNFTVCNYGMLVHNLIKLTDYLTITAAIADANLVGDVIQVDAGIYDERLVINKSLTLRGATSGVSKRGFAVPAAYAYDPATQSIIRPGTAAELAVIAVAADGVVIDGFVVANEVCQTGGVYQDLIGIAQALAAPTGVQILNCVLGPNTNTAAQDGTMGRSGVTVYGPHAAPVKLIVMHNKIFDSKGNGAGIMIVGPYGPTYHGGAAYASYFAGSVIEDNDIIGNHRTGIELAGGVQGGTAWAEHFIIRNNLIAGNGWYSLAEKDNLKFGHGVMFIRANSDRAYSDAAGSRYVRLENNVIRDNEKSGLYVGATNRDLFGTGNFIQDNGKGTGGYSLWDGVRIDLDELYYASGATYTDYGFLANVSFTAGNILGNGAQGVRVMQTPTAGPVSAGCNWWGNVLGPNVPPGNPSPGNGITGLATYAPWLNGTIPGGLCNQYGANYVAPVAPVTCVTPVNTCVPVPVNFTRADATPVRGYSVTLTLSSNLALCGSGIVEGSYLSNAGGTQFGPVVSLGGGVYTVDCAILGPTAGATGPGTLFTLNLAGTVTGTGTVTVNSVVVRDLLNGPIAANPGAPASITIDYTAPVAIANLAAAQVKSGNDGSGTTKIRLTFTAPADAAKVHLYRAGWGNYPEYDDVGGGVPVWPGAPGVWTLAATLAAPVAAYDDQAAWPARDFWYYVAVVEDACGNLSAVSNQTSGTLNYHLGDVASGCAGDNAVGIADISFLGANYGVTLGYPDARACLDVGPTTDNSVNARPLTDNKVGFEDLMMFAINYGTVTAPQNAMMPVAAANDELSLDGPAQVTAGMTFTVSLRMKGAGDLQGLSAQLGWDRSIAEPVSVEAGGLAEAQNAVVFSSGAGNVDCALLGANRGLTGEGVLATVTFRALANGAPAVTLAKLDARNLGNQPVSLAGVKAATVTATQFAPAMPNPFRGTTTLSYALAKGGAVELAVYGVDGRKVATLASGVQEAGTYRLSWDGAGARPGLYYARLTTPEGKFTRTLVLTR
jgi:hypothetical protein